MFTSNRSQSFAPLMFALGILRLKFSRNLFVVLVSQSERRKENLAHYSFSILMMQKMKYASDGSYASSFFPFFLSFFQLFFNLLGIVALGWSGRTKGSQR